MARFEIRDMDGLAGPRGLALYEFGILFRGLATTAIYCNTREADESR
jgi:hypothetical protein